jgi:hypothetical protein
MFKTSFLSVAIAFTPAAIVQIVNKLIRTEDTHTEPMGR